MSTEHDDYILSLKRQLDVACMTAFSNAGTNDAIFQSANQEAHEILDEIKQYEPYYLMDEDQIEQAKMHEDWMDQQEFNQDTDDAEFEDW